MRVVAAVLLASLGLGVSFAGASSGTCTISQFVNANPSLGLDFPVPVANGVQMPVEFDEASGTFSMSRNAWVARFGTPYCSFTTTQSCTTDADCQPPTCPTCNPPSGDSAEVCATGAEFLTVGTVHGFILMSPGTVTGTIDGAGTISLPHFEETLQTDFEKPLRPLTDMPNLSTTLTQTTVGGVVYTTRGVPLDFTTGDVTLIGTGPLQNAPGSNGPTASGILMACRLSPVPDRTKLPAAATLKVAAGKARIGGPVAANDKGDVLSLKLALTPGGVAIDPTAGDLFVRIAAGTQEVVLLLVPAGKLQPKGKKKLVATDTDGTIIQVLTGHKQSGDTSSAFGGSLTIAKGKKAAALKGTVQGLDLGALTGAATVTVVVDGVEASKSVTVKGSGSTRKFK